MDCSQSGFSIHGIFYARILEWVAISSCRGSSWPKDRADVSRVSCIEQVESLPAASPGKPRDLGRTQQGCCVSCLLLLWPITKPTYLKATQIFLQFNFPELKCQLSMADFFWRFFGRIWLCLLNFQYPPAFIDWLMTHFPYHSSLLFPLWHLLILCL